MSDVKAINPENCSPFMRSVMDNIRHNPGADIIRYSRRREGVIALGMGETDTPTPSFITGPVIEALQTGQTFYGPILGRNDLRQEIANYHERIYGLKLPLDRVIVTSSGTSAIHLSLTSILEKGDEVVTIVPVWKNLLGAIHVQEAIVRPVELHLNADNSAWALDLDEMFAAVTPRTRAFVINTPNNPTGWIMPVEQMRAVMDFARKRGIWVISDEVYGRLTYDMECAPSFLDVAEPDDRLFIVNSFSKNWAMTGWRLGWLIAPAEAEKRIYDLVLYDNMGPPNFTQFGGIAALREGEGFLQEQKERFRKNADIVWDSFARLEGVSAARPQSSFYAFFKRDGEADCMEFAKRLIDDHGIGLAPGCGFGQNAAGYMRLCYAVSEPVLREALDRLEKGLK